MGRCHEEIAGGVARKLANYVGWLIEHYQLRKTRAIDEVTPFGSEGVGLMLDLILRVSIVGGAKQSNNDDGGKADADTTYPAPRHPRLLSQNVVAQRTEPEPDFASSCCLLGGLTMGQRPGCYVASYAPGNIADTGLLCKNKAFTRARVVSSPAPTKVDAWVTHAGMDRLIGFNA